MFNAYESGEMRRARQLHYEVIACPRAIAPLGSAIAITRAATEPVGIPVGPPREPTLPIDVAGRDRIEGVCWHALLVETVLSQLAEDVRPDLSHSLDP